MDSSSPCGHWSRALVPGGRGPVFIPALLTAGGRLTDLLLLDFAGRAGRRVGRPCLGQDYLVSRGNLRPKSGIADPERLAGDAVTMLAEQVRDDVCDLVGCARPVDFERHRVDGDVTLMQL